MNLVRRRLPVIALLGLVTLPLACGGGSSTAGTGGTTAGSGGTTAGTGGTTAGTGGTTAGTGGTTAGTGGTTAGTGGATAGTGGATVGTGGATASGGSAGTAVTGSGGAGGKTTGGGGAAGGSSGDGITGMYNDQAILPVMSGIWIGKPQSANETGGGPFVYLFSGPVTCADLSKASGWLPTIPLNTQVLELLIGTKTTGTAVTVSSAGAGAGMLEANYASGMQLGEHGAKSGSVTLTSYMAGKSVEGTVDVVFPVGSAKGKFHADWCAGGQEI